MKIADLQDEVTRAWGESTLPHIYKEKVLSNRTRNFVLLANYPSGIFKKISIQYTLLGVELKVGERRFSCPDIATAAYLQVFARIGVSQVAIPYDISKIPSITQDLEVCLDRLITIINQLTENLSLRHRKNLHNQLIVFLRKEIEILNLHR